MKKIVRVKSNSFCPLSNEGVRSQLNEIQDTHDTLSKFVEGEANKAEDGTFICNIVFTAYQTERRFDTIPATI